MLRTHLGLAALALALGAPLPACKGNAEAEKICQQASDRYLQCVEEILGPDARAYAASPGKDGRAQCAADEATVAMYTKCLPEKDCSAFMDCLTAAAGGPAP